MAATAAKSAKLTLDAMSKREGGRAHHIGDFLPKDKLGETAQGESAGLASRPLRAVALIPYWLCSMHAEMFLAKCRSVVKDQGANTKEGAAAAQALSDYSQNRLGSDNLGFQMLRGLGWTEGSGTSHACLSWLGARPD